MFIENRGQVDRAAAYYARIGSSTVWLSPFAIAFDVVRGEERLVFGQRFVGADGSLRLRARRRQPGTYNFLAGGDHTSSAGYGEVRYRRAWAGIDVRLAGRGRALEQDYLVRPGADPGRIRIAYRGVERLRIARDGALLIHTAFGTLRESPPRVYQPIDGRRVRVPGRYRLLSRSSYTFALGRHRRDAPLVIDPRIAYAHYLGGSGANSSLSPFVDGGPEYARDVAVDGAGNAYVAGITHSPDFPGFDPARTHYSGFGDAFVTKIDAAGVLAFTTYLGSGGQDEAFGIALDRAGSAYLTGMTTSGTELGTPGAAQPRNRGVGVAAGLIEEGFLTKLDPSGRRIVWSTYIGGVGDDQANDVAVDSAGNAYVTGTTNSRNLLLANPAQPAPGGPADSVLPHISQTEDAFVAKVSADGSRFLYATYLGGSGDERGRGIAVDPSGVAYVTGQTASRDLRTVNALQNSRRGASDAFVATIPAGGGSFAAATYLGGSDDEGAFGIAVDRSGRPWLTGETGSKDFPVRNAAQRRSGDAFETSTDAFVVALAPGAGVLSYGTYLGGASRDQGFDVALDATGDAYVTGATLSRADPARHYKGFPTKHAFQRKRGFSEDAFVARIDGRSGKLSYSSPLGGSDDDLGFGIAADSARNAYVVGSTTSPDFPGVRGRGRTGAQDGFIAKIAPGGTVAPALQPPLVYADLVGPAAIRSGRPAEFTIVFGNSGEVDARSVPLWIDGIPADATWSVDADLLGPTGVSPADSALAARMPRSLVHGDKQLLPLFLPVIPAGATGSITLTLTVPREQQLTLRAWADPPMRGTGAGVARAAQEEGHDPIREAARECLEHVFVEAIEHVLQAVVPFECIVSIEKLVSHFGERELDRFFNNLDGKPGVYSSQRLIVQAIKAGLACVKDVAEELLIESELLEVSIEAILELANRAKLEEIVACKLAFTAGEGMPPTGEAGGSAPGVSVHVRAGKSFDPNDKVGSRGHGRGHYVSGREPLRYTILFENLEKAALPAQQVVITDQLPRALDLDTVRFGRVAFGSRRAGPAAGVSSLATTVDLRPERDLIVRIEASLDRPRRLATWRLRALDPSGGPPADPLAGFLPPNIHPPAGQGNVTLFARARRGVRTGKRIRNRATIVFDDNAPIATPAHVNRIDRSLPSSRVSRVKRRSAMRLRVRWRGRDRGSGMGHFTVFASENGRRFKALRARTRSRVGTVKAKRGRSYVLYAAAQDRAGNVERVPMVGELLTPALRPHPRGSGFVVRTRFFVQRPGRLTLRVRGRKTRMLRGSRLGGKVLHSARRTITATAVGPGRVKLSVRLRARGLPRRPALAVHGGGRGGGTLTIPFRRP